MMMVAVGAASFKVCREGMLQHAIRKMQVIHDVRGRRTEVYVYEGSKISSGCDVM
jgi:hypothetical protein